MNTVNTLKNLAIVSILALCAIAIVAIMIFCGADCTQNVQKVNSFIFGCFLTVLFIGAKTTKLI